MPPEVSGEDVTSRSICIFRGIEYVVTVSCTGNGRSLVVEAEDKLTADQWRGKFDCAYVEDLTRKTGNFKQFPVFVSMLQSALEKNSDSVTLDLLTYSDLELLRNRKVGTSAKPIPNSQALAQQNKRYLILIYSVEFDRIHYPLPLQYQGKPDPVHLQNLVRKLNDEIRSLKIARTGIRNKDYEQLKDDYEELLHEKENLEHEISSLQSQIKDNKSLTVSKEVRILKKVVQNLELEMVQEKNKYQRLITKKTGEIKRLSLELQEVQTKERTLQIRVKSLTNELAIYKRTRTPNISGRISSASRRSTRGIADTSSYSINRSGLRPRPQSRSQSRERSINRSNISARSTSRECKPLRPLSNRSTPNSRFDPTSYVEEKRRKQRESEERRKRIVKSGLTPGSGDSRIGRTRSRVNSNSRMSSGDRYRRSILRDRSSSLESRRSNGSVKSSTGSIIHARRKPKVGWEYSPKKGFKRLPRKRSSTPDYEKFPPSVEDMSLVDQDYSDNMAEIDARLTALQQYMSELGACG